MGYNNVFMHVGDHVRIQAPNGQYVAPLVTGTFGGSDFMYSLLGGTWINCVGCSTDLTLLCRGYGSYCSYKLHSTDHVLLTINYLSDQMTEPGKISFFLSYR